MLRLPVFLMGVCVGLLALRQVEDPHHHHALLHDVFPWSLSSTSSSSTSSSFNQSDTDLERSWARRVDRNSLLLIGLILYNVVRLD